MDLECSWYILQLYRAKSPYITLPTPTFGINIPQVSAIILVNCYLLRIKWSNSTLYATHRCVNGARLVVRTKTNAKGPWGRTPKVGIIGI